MLSVAGPDLDQPAPGSVRERDFRRGGTDESIAGVVRQHGAALSGFLRRLARGDHQRAEDIYQETLIRAWKHPEYRQEGVATNRGWLFTVARRISIDQLRAAAVPPAEAGGRRRGRGSVACGGRRRVVPGGRRRTAEAGAVSREDCAGCLEY